MMSSSSFDRYRCLEPKDLPSTEALQDTLNRTLPYWEREIFPQVKAGKKCVGSAHGNSLRCVDQTSTIKVISDEDISGLNIPTGIPLVYDFEGGTVVDRHVWHRKRSWPRRPSGHRRFVR